jgi:hypothetical protein
VPTAVSPIDDLDLPRLDVTLSRRRGDRGDLLHPLCPSSQCEPRAAPAKRRRRSSVQRRSRRHSDRAAVSMRRRVARVVAAPSPWLRIAARPATRDRTRRRMAPIRAHTRRPGAGSATGEGDSPRRWRVAFGAAPADGGCGVIAAFRTRRPSPPCRPGGRRRGAVRARRRPGRGRGAPPARPRATVSA